MPLSTAQSIRNIPLTNTRTPVRQPDKITPIPLLLPVLHSTILRFRVLCKYLNLIFTIDGDFSFYRKLFGTLSHEDLGSVPSIVEDQALAGDDSGAGSLLGRERFTAGFVDKGGVVAADRSLALLPGG